MIALVEGKRRALQSSFERENKENRAKITALDEQLEVRDLNCHLQKHTQSVIRTRTKHWKWQAARQGIF